MIGPSMNKVILLPLLLSGCHDAAQRRPDVTEKGGAMTAAAAVKMKEGPATRPSGPLLSWLNENARTAAGKKRRFRLPVAVTFEDEHRLAVGTAHIGAAGPDAVALALDDTGLSVALLDTLQQRCPKGEPGCTVWLEGYWGELMDAPMPEFGAPSKDGAKRWPFAVLKVHERVASGADARPAVEE